MDEIEIRGVPTRVWKNAPGTLRNVLDLSSLHGDKPLVVYEDETISFDRHYRLASAFAHRLIHEYGVQKGDRVALAMRNFPEWLVAFWGATAAGAIIVPLNAWWTGPELEYGIKDSGAKVLVADEERAQRLRPYSDLGLDGITSRPQRASIGRGERSWADFLGDVAADVTRPTSPSIPTTTRRSSTRRARPVFPKGALGTHRNICTNVMSLAFGAFYASARKPGGSTDLEEMASGASAQATLLSVPLFHVTGCHAIMLSSVAFGAKLVIMYKWDPERALELIERERVTTIGGVPAMIWQLLESPSFEKTDLSSVKAIGYGGAPAPPELVRRIEEFLPGRMPSNGWGMTETSSTASSNNGVDYIAKPTSCGPPLPINDVLIVDEDGNEQPQGTAGELWVRGTQRREGLLAQARGHGGELRRRRLAAHRRHRVARRRGLHLHHRSREGHDHPRRRERVLRRGRGRVVRASGGDRLCRVRIPHEVLGEEVAAVVLLRGRASATENELQVHVRERLASFKVPVKVWFWDEELPRNPRARSSSATSATQRWLWRAADYSEQAGPSPAALEQFPPLGSECAAVSPFRTMAHQSHSSYGSVGRRGGRG